MSELVYIDDTFPSHQIIEMIAENPTSRVFLAEREDTLYVIKEQPKEFCFLQNPAVLRELSYPGLPKIIDFWQTDKSIFYSYEYINGVTLTEAYESGLISTGAAVAITEKLCGIVAYLHGKSLMHCDIKPDNILIHGDDVFLIDFGIAHVYSKNSGGETALIGSEGFVTPELGYKKTDFRADVYAIGMVLFYLLTGSADIKELPRKVHDRPLRAIVGRAANYDVGKRYKSAAKLQEAIRKYKKGTVYRPFFAAMLAACFVAIFIAGGLVFPAVYQTVSAYVGAGNLLPYAFSDPLIEQAIRLSLGKTAGEPVYRDELALVEQLYFVGDRAFATWDEQQAYLWPFYDAGQSPPHSEFVSTADIAACENLKILDIQYSNLDSIDFLAAHQHIRELKLGNTLVADIAVIRTLPLLTILSLDDCAVSDLSPIKDCPQVEHLTLFHPRAQSYDFVNPDKQYVSVSIGYIHYEFFMAELSGLTTERLYLADCGIPGFDVFPDMTITETLELRDSLLTDTTGAARILADGAEVLL